MNKDFWNDRVVVITGASSGIGYALYQELSHFPSTLFLLARRAKSIPLPEFPTKAKIYRLACDMANPHSVAKVTKDILKQTDQVDVLFNNAGITAHGRFDELRLDVYHSTFAVNYFGPLQLIQSLLPALKKAHGNIVTTSTVSALYGVPGRSAYSASKSALHASLESLRVEMLKENLGVSLVCVPYTETALRTSGLDAKGNLLSEPQAKGKRKTAKEVALVLIAVAERKEARLVTFNFSGRFVNWMRILAPRFLEKILYKKLSHDFLPPKGTV